MLGRYYMARIAGLAAEGFSMEQIIEECTLDGEFPDDDSGRIDPAVDRSDGETDGSTTISVELSAGGRATTLGTLESGSLVALVEGDTATITVDWVFHVFIAGGPDELGRNCEARIRETVTGVGAAGDTAIPLVVETSELTDVTGSQCDGGGTAFYEEVTASRQAEAKTGGNFIGVVDLTQIDGALGFVEVEVFGTP